MTPEQRVLTLLVVVALVAALLKLLSNKAPVPFPVVLAVAGILGGVLPGFPAHILSPATLLLAFIPGLVFEAALNLDLSQLRRLVAPVGILATLGVALTVGGVAATAHAIMGIPWLQGALLGAILAPSDPIAVVSVVRGTRAPIRLITLLEGESLFNDGTGIAVFAAVSTAIAAGGTVVASDLGTSLLGITAGGVGIGLMTGLVGVVLLRSTTDTATEILVTLITAYGSYLAADLAHVSGVVATVTAGIVIAGVARRASIHAPQVRDVWSLIAFVLNAVLFLLVGSEVPARAIVAVVPAILAVLLVVIVVRALGVLATLAVFDRGLNKIAGRWRGLAIVGGMRGALSVALALSITGRNDLDHRLAPVACGVALISLIVQGSTSPLFMQGGNDLPRRLWRITQRQRADTAV